MRGAAHDAAHNAGLVRNSDRAAGADSNGMLRVDTKQTASNSGSDGAVLTDKERREEFHRNRAESIKNVKPKEAPPVEDADLFGDDDESLKTDASLRTASKFQSEIDMLKRTVNELVLRSQYSGLMHNNSSLQGQFHDSFF